VQRSPLAQLDACDDALNPSCFQSLVNFLRDPTGDIPWEEDSSATDVLHLDTAAALTTLLKKEKRPILLMFYAPCKQTRFHLRLKHLSFITNTRHWISQTTRIVFEELLMSLNCWMILSCPDAHSLCVLFLIHHPVDC
jgi:hypothetical protein